MNTSSPIRILIADDHAIVRDGIAAILSVQPDMQVIGQACDGVDAVQAACQLQPDVMLLDMVMPRQDGLAAIQQIKETNPAIRILVLTSFADDKRVFPAIKSGALGYLLKDTPRHQLLQAIRDVARGQAHLHPVIAMKMMR